MKKLVPMLAALLAASGCAPADPWLFQADNAVVTVPAVPGGPGAAYFTLRTTRENARLVSVSSPAFERAELHGTMSRGNMSGMVPLAPQDLAFTASAPLTFAPGGKHAMLFGVDPSLRPGGKVQLTLNLEPGGPLTVEADVVGPGQAHAGH